jgi:hypothetical protein
MSVRDGPFHPLKIDAVPCDPEVIRQHLGAFVQSFIRKARQPRAEHIVFRLAAKQAHRLGQLQSMLDERYTSPTKQLRLPSGLPDLGVYFAGGRDGWIIHRSDAELASGYLGCDAIWSGVPGTYGMFLHHEGTQWLCYREKAGA